MMEVMLNLLNMSFGAGICVLLVLLVRGIIGAHLPKVYSYLLWFLVLFRMICPFSLPSPASLFPVNPEPIQQEILYSPVPQVDTGIVWLNQPVNHILEEKFKAKEEDSITPIQGALAVWIVIWGMGFLGIWIVQGYKFFLLSRRLYTACRWDFDRTVKTPLFISDRISGAFILGIFRPKIYLPALADQREQKFILAHELVHIRRRDYLVKAVWFAALTVYWFQPLLWLGFLVMCQDMEVSCDLAAVRKFSVKERKEYSQTLLHFAEKQSRVWTIMAFGEHPVKSRIKHILRMKKPAKLGIWAGIFLLFLAGAGFLTNPVRKEKSEELYGEDLREEEETEHKQDDDSSVIVIGGADGPTSIFLAGKQTDTSEISGEDWEKLSKSTVERNYADSGQEDEAILENIVYLDAASEDLVVFHTMEAGLFIVQKKGEVWKWTGYYPKEEMNNIEELLNEFQEFSAENQRSITIEDRYILQNPKSYSREESHPLEYDITKWEDGRIALLGGFNNRLIDLFYGWYTPGDPVFHQVYLFDKTGKEWVQEGVREVWYSDQEGKWITYLEDSEEK